MSKLHEKVAYLKGLAQGLGVEPGSKEAKLLLSVIDVLGDFADEIGEGDARKNAPPPGSRENAPNGDMRFVCPNCGEAVEIGEETVKNAGQAVCGVCGEAIVILTSEL